MSELFGLQWHDIDFHKNEINVTRSIVFQVVGPCKTEASQKPVPLDARLAEALKLWRHQTKYGEVGDWVFASPAALGQRPYWGQCLMRTIIRPAALRIGIKPHIGWHTFRHTYSSLLRANKTDIKVTQELLRHASSRVTLDTYTQAITLQKRKAQSDIIRLLPASGAAAGQALVLLFLVCAYAKTPDLAENIGRPDDVVRHFTTKIVPFLCL
jgi:integrase